VAQQAQNLAQQTQEKAGDLVDQAQDQVKTGLTTGKERAAGSLGAIAQALRQTGQQFHQQHQDAIGGFADSAAGQVDRIAGYLHNRDIDQLARETENLARSQPALFMGGALALGFVAARFLKSSRPMGDEAAGHPTDVYSRPANSVPTYPTASSFDRPPAAGAVTSHG